MQITGQGLILPRLEKIPFIGTEIGILEIHPDNGYSSDGTPIASERSMVKVRMPDGYTKNLQVKNLLDLLEKVKILLTSRYAVTSFEFDTVPLLTVGEKIILKEIQ